MEIALPIVVFTFFVLSQAGILWIQFLERDPIRFIREQGVFPRGPSLHHGFSAFGNYELAFEICRKRKLPQPQFLKQMHAAVWFPLGGATVTVAFIVLVSLLS